MKNDRRTFYIYDLELAARKDGASVPDMQQALAVWDKLRTAGTTYSIQAGDGTMLIGDIVMNAVDNYATLLIRLSDKKAPNSVYSDPAAGHFSEHAKIGNMGADYACHVIISLAPELTQPNVYTCVIEKVTGLNSGYVQRLLSKFLNIEYHQNSTFFQYPAPGGGVTRAGNPRMERCCPHVELRGRPSQTLINDINNGYLTGISLVRTEAVTPIAGAAYLKKATSELKLTIDRGNMPAQLWSSLEQAIKQNSGAYGAAKVSYRKPGSKRTVTVDIDATTAAPFDDLYVESFDVGPIFPPLAQSASAVVPRLTAPAITQFLAVRNI